MVKKLEQEKRLNLKNDVIFKTFFSRKGNEKFLIDFLSALLKIEIKNIKIMGEVTLEQLAKDEKGGRIDIQAELNNGIVIDIEMQMEDEKNIEERTTYYAAKILSKETKKGTEYKNIKQVIMINILNYEMLGFDEYISETVTVLDKHREYEVIKGVKWYFIELPKFRKIEPDMNEKLNQWLAFIDDYDKELVKVAKGKNKTLKEAGIEMNYLTGDEEVRRLAELREKWEMDYNSGIGNARREGKEEGIKEGIKETKLEVVKKMKEEKLPVELIIKITGLTKEEIEKL